MERGCHSDSLHMSWTAESVDRARFLTNSPTLDEPEPVLQITSLLVTGDRLGGPWLSLLLDQALTCHKPVTFVYKIAPTVTGIKKLPAWDEFSYKCLKKWNFFAKQIGRDLVSGDFSGTLFLTDGAGGRLSCGLDAGWRQGAGGRVAVPLPHSALVYSAWPYPPRGSAAGGGSTSVGRGYNPSSSPNWPSSVTAAGSSRTMVFSTPSNSTRESAKL